MSELKVKPWDRPVLLALNRYANIDKHRLLIATSALAGVTFNGKIGGVEFTDATIMGEAGKDLNLVQASGPFMPEDASPVIITRIDEPSVKIFHGENLLTVLEVMAKETVEITSLMKAAG